MAGKGREVADAYIEVHGDLSKFRRSLDGIRKDARKEGENAGDAFADGMADRYERQMGRRMNGLMDSIYENNQGDWDKLFGEFDSKNLDEAYAKLTEFTDKAKEEGRLNEEQWQAVNNSINEAYDHTSRLRGAEEDRLRVQRGMTEESDRFNRSLEGMIASNALDDLEKDFKGIAKAMNDTDWSKLRKAGEDIDDFEIRMSDTIRTMHRMDRVSASTMGDMSERVQAYAEDERARERALALSREEADRLKRSMENLARDTEIARQAAERHKRSFAGMREALEADALEKDFQRITKAMHDADWSNWTKGADDLDKVRDRIDAVTAAMWARGRASQIDAEQIRATAHGAIEAEDERRKAIERTTRAQKEAEERAKRLSRTLTGMRSAAASAKLEQDFRGIVAALDSMDWSGIAQGNRNFREMDTNVRNVMRTMQQHGRVTDEEFGLVDRRLREIRRNHREFNVEFDNTNRHAGFLGRTFDALGNKIKTSWARMDSTVRMVLTLIAAGASDIAPLGSGAAGAITAVGSSIAMAAASVVPLAAALAGMGVAAGLAAASWDTMTAQFPGIQAGITAIGNAWQVQATRFGQYWGSALDTLLNNFASKLGKYDFGTPMGIAVQGITLEFNNLVNSPGFNAFLKAMSKELPEAVHGFGDGLANVLTGLMSLLAGAAPAAQSLAESFHEWSEGIEKGLESARKSGELGRIFDLAADSLRTVLDLTGSIGAALGTLFMAAAPIGNVMLDDLTNIVDKFNQWMQSTEGQGAIVKWLTDARVIMGSLEPVLVGLGQAMDNLVTPASIESLVSLMSTIGQILPVMGQLLAAVSALQIFNIIADAINLVMVAIAPLMGPLNDLTQALGTALVGAVQALRPVFAGIGAVLEPFISAISRIVQDNAPKFVEVFQKIGQVLGPILGILGQVAGAIMGVLAPALSWIVGGILDNIINGFQGLVDIIEGVKKMFTGDFAGGFKQALSGLWNALVNFLALFGAGKIAGIIGKGLSGLGGLIMKGLSKVKDIGKNLWDGLLLGLAAGVGAVISFFSDMINNIINWVKSLFGVHSPSVIFMEIGQFLMEGLIQGIQMLVGAVTAIFTTVFNGIMTVITTIVTGIVSFLSTAWTGISAVIGAVWNGILTVITTVVNFISMIITTVFSAIGAFLSMVVQGWAIILTTVWTAIQGAVTAAVNFVATIIRTVLGAIAAFLTTVVTGWRIIITTAWTAIRAAVTTAVNFVRTIITTVFNAIKAYITAVLNGYRVIFTTVWNAIRTAVTTVVNAVRTVITTVFNAVKSTITSILNGIRSTFTSVWNAIKSAVTAAINAVRSTVSSVLNGIRSTVSSILSGIKSTFSSAWSAMKSTVSSAWNNIKSAVSSGISGVMGFVRGLPGQISGALSGLGGLLTGAGNAIMEGFLSGLQAVWGKITSFVGGIASWIAAHKGPISYDRTLLVPAGQAIMGGLNEGLEDGMAPLGRVLGDVTDQIATGLDTDAMMRTAEMLSAVLAVAFAQSKFYLVGKDAGEGLAAGLLASKEAVGSALGTLSPTATATIGTRFTPVPAADAGRTSDQPVIAGGNKVIESGAIQIITPTTNPEIVANKVLDGIANYSSF